MDDSQRVLTADAPVRWRLDVEHDAWKLGDLFPRRDGGWGGDGVGHRGGGWEPAARGWWGRSGGSGWDFGEYQMAGTLGWPVEWGRQSGWGFRLDWTSGTGGTGYEANVPYWFLLLGFGAIAGVVWRMTRVKARMMSAFPVETAGVRH